MRAAVSAALVAAAAAGPPISPYAPVFPANAVPPTAPSAWPSDVPFWPRYDSRRVTVLNGTWSFGYADGGTVDPVTIRYDQIATPNTTTVPASFDVAPMGIAGPRGNAFFRSTHACTPKVPALLKFAAVNHYARVFVDGVDVGNHTAGPYTPFELLAPPCAASGLRELLVVVNNEKNATLAPTYTGGDFSFYSGIIRAVIVTELSMMASTYPYYIAHVSPLTVDYTRGLVDVRVTLGGDVGAITSGVVHLSYAFNGGAMGAAVACALVNGTAVIPSVAVPGFKLWTPGADNTDALFTLSVLETASKDVVTVRSGVRQVAVDAASARVTVNGQVVKMLGFNRHTMWPDSGAASTPEKEAADMAVLKSMNVNYVRGAHYPQSQSWLDRCDEAGIMMWEEALGPGTSTGNMHDPWFMANHLAAVTSMVTTSAAHPSVIIHGFFNEGPSNDPNACVGYAASAQRIRELSGTPQRVLVTWANNHGSSDACIDYEDVYSRNAYPGWYGPNPGTTNVSTFWAEEIAWLATNWPAKPMLVSETGGGGIFEWLNTSAPAPGPMWSQAFQSALVSADITNIAGSDRVSGLTIWQFSDIKVDNTGCAQCEYQQPTPPTLAQPWTCASISSSCGRPGGENHKGCVDAWRRQKLEVEPIAALYAKYAAQPQEE